MTTKLIYTSCDKYPSDSSMPLPAVRSSALAPVATAYIRNRSEVLYLVALPYVLMSASAMERARGAATMQAVANVINARHPAQDIRARVKEEEERLLGGRRDPENVRMEDEWVWSQLHIFQGLDGVDAAFRALLYAGTVLSWSGFECFAKDLWVAALNAKPERLGRSAAEAQDRRGREGASSVGKMVPFYLLEQYGFDLRTSMGSILGSKFDFTSISGIRSAYAAAFGDLGPKLTEDDAALLSELEALRHVIVHNGGVADEMFVRRTGGRFPLGRRIELDTERTAELATAASRVACIMLTAVDDCLSAGTS